MAVEESEIMRRCEVLDKDSIYGLFFMLIGGMTQTDCWATFSDTLAHLLPGWEKPTTF